MKKLPIAIIQLPKPYLIPRLNFHRFLRLHPQPVSVSAVCGIHICQLYYISNLLKSGVDAADRVVRQDTVHTPRHLSHCKGKFSEFNMLFILFI